MLIMKRTDGLAKATDALRASLVSIAEDFELTGAEKKAMAAQTCRGFEDHIAGQFQKSERVEFRKDAPMVSEAEAMTSAISISKMVNAGLCSARVLPKYAWNAFIAKGAAAVRKTNETEAQSYVRFITRDPGGRELFKAMSFADGPDHVVIGKEAPTPTDSPAIGPAAREMQMLAEDHRKANPRLSPEGAYVHVYTHPDNAALREKCKAEHMAAMAAA